MLEMIQQKSMHRKSETGGLTAFSKACAQDDEYSQNLDATRLIAAQQCKKTERHVNQLLHSGAGDLTANNDHAVAPWQSI